MKKITLLFTLMFTTCLMFGQVVLTEDFEAGLSLPAGWTNNDIAANAEIWEFQTGGEAGGFTPPNTFIYDPAGCVGNYATFDSDGYGDLGTAEEAALESPVFDCSALTQVALDFNMLFAGNFGGSGFIETSTDGSTWTTVVTYTGDGNVFAPQTVDLSTELAGQATSQIRFRWTGNWSLSWTIDNIVVSQCTDTASPAVVSAPVPSDTATNVTINADGNGLDFSWTEGGPTTSFTLNFDIVSPPVANSFENFGNGNTITGLAENTEYFWSIDAVNCFGTTAGPVWSFTTGLALSVEENQLEIFSAYPNPTSNVLNIKTTKEIDNFTVFNLLGQNVATYSKNDISNDSIDLSELSKGLYLVKISAEGTTQTIRVAKE
jgi:hypothetical protein